MEGQKQAGEGPKATAMGLLFSTNGFSVLLGSVLRSLIPRVERLGCWIIWAFLLHQCLKFRNFLIVTKHQLMLIEKVQLQLSIGKTETEAFSVYMGKHERADKMRNMRENPASVPPGSPENELWHTPVLEP